MDEEEHPTTYIFINTDIKVVICSCGKAYRLPTHSDEMDIVVPDKSKLALISEFDGEVPPSMEVALPSKERY